MLLERWLLGQAPLNISQLCRLSAASRPTVTAAVEDLRARDLVGSPKDGRVQLYTPSWPQLQRLAEDHGAERQVLKLVDPTGHARPPRQMAERLMQLKSRGVAHAVAIGGVIGATYYYPEIDITGPPWLDLSVYDGDISFLEKLDAGLIPLDASDRKEPFVLAVRLQHDCRSEDEPTRREGIYSSRLDCLADLVEMNLQPQDADFGHFLVQEATSRCAVGHPQTPSER